MAVRTPVGLSPEIPLVIKRELTKLSSGIATVHSNVNAITSAQGEAVSRIRRTLSDLGFLSKPATVPVTVAAGTAGAAAVPVKPPLTGGTLGKILHTLFDAVGPGALTEFPGAGFGPLVLTGLLGHAAQPQIAGVPNVAALPAGGPYSQPTSLVSVNGVLYGYKTGPNTPQLPYNSPTLTGTHAQRLSTYPATKYPAGMLFWETDRTVFYIVKLISAVPTWVYAAGIMPVTQALLPSDLGTADGGFLALVSDYPDHVLLWNGVTWQYGPGDPGTRWTAIGDTAGNPPQGGAWGLCDGSSYNCLNGNGTVSSVPTHNLTGDVFVQGGAVAGQQAATAPTWDPAATTAAESFHKHSVTEPSSLLASFNYTPGGTTENISGVAGGTVISGPGDPHVHALTNSLSKLNPPSEANGGLPIRTAVLWYMRR